MSDPNLPEDFDEACKTATYHKVDAIETVYVRVRMTELAAYLARIRAEERERLLSEMHQRGCPHGCLVGCPHYRMLNEMSADRIRKAPSDE